MAHDAALAHEHVALRHLGRAFYKGVLNQLVIEQCYRNPSNYFLYTSCVQTNEQLVMYCFTWSRLRQDYFWSLLLRFHIIVKPKTTKQLFSELGNKGIMSIRIFNYCPYFYPLLICFKNLSRTASPASPHTSPAPPPVGASGQTARRRTPRSC